ncbi:MAG TPA: SpoIID/LytB domain-containing protein [Pyrinomonadaceae bacterium]|nr:SpoIID/LytB domain-containing protein [Pyrinomonadaceae bacterium]
MRSNAVSTLALLLSSSLLLSSFAFAQERREETRPRQTSKTTGGTPVPRTEPPPTPESPQPQQWKAPEQSITRSAVQKLNPSEPEPVMRIALATDVRAATVSTNSQLLSATDLAQTFVPLDVARVRVESRSLSPVPAVEENFGVKMDGLSSRAMAESQAKLIRDAIAEQSKIVLDVETQTWGLLIGPKRSRDAAEIAQQQLDEAGFSTTVVDLKPETDSPTPSIANSSQKPIVNNANANPYVRLAARSANYPTREVVASSGASAKLFSSSAPVLFASDDEAKAPVRFNDKPYRGRIEVFANTRGLLTIVNVIALEDYVRGVVANELSPGGYPALEALKAQAIAARTYAVRNRGQFMSQGYDLLPTTRSQVYRGLSSEQPLSTRAVDETRGMVATYDGQPINALYTSTCGGRTEDAANIFTEEVPYLHSRECSLESHGRLDTFVIKSSRDIAEVREEQFVPLARLAAELSVHGFASLTSRVTDSWLSATASSSEVRAWLSTVAALAHQTLPSLTDDVNRPPQFATALSAATFGESRADTLLNNVDVEYFLAIKDGSEVPPANRADVALMVRDGYLSVFPDVSLRPREAMSRARVLRAIARLLENRNLLQMQKATSRPTAEGNLILRSARGKEQSLRVTSDAFLFRQLGDSVYPVRSVILVGGEPVTYHVNSSGVVDYLEVRPAPGGAAADRFSPFSNWTSELSAGAVRARLGRAASGIGSLVDLKVASRGQSRRATDLEVIGTTGTAHVRGGRIRSALGLREQLFVIDKKYDDEGNVAAFVFTGRGWGHGVGMCQVGAYGLAKQGFSYEQILKAYYTGIEVTRMY